jgi:hypothetical protein
MALRETDVETGADELAPHFPGDPTNYPTQPRRRLALGPNGARFDIHTHTASPEGVVTVAADAVGALCVVVQGGDTELWAFEGTPGQNTGWVQLGTGGGGGGATDFTDLGDVPASYAGAAAYLLRVNAGATALEFVDGTTLFDALNAAASAVSTHDGDAAAHAGLARKMLPSATVHSTDFTATENVIERWSDAATLTGSLPDGAGLANGARFGFASFPGAGGGKLTVTCLGSKTFLGITGTLAFAADQPPIAGFPLIFMWDATADHWVIEEGYLPSLIASLSVYAENFALVTKSVAGVKRLELLQLTADTALGVKTGSADVVAVPFADIVAAHDADPDAHDYVHPGGVVTIYVAGTTGDDANDGSQSTQGAGTVGPVQTLARAVELAPTRLTSYDDLIEIVVVEGNAANAPFAWPSRAYWRGIGCVHVRVDLSLVTEVVASQAITGYTLGYCTHAGTPFTANAQEGNFREWLTGTFAAASVIEMVGANGTNFTRATQPWAYDDDFNPLVDPSPGDTYRIVQPLVPIVAEVGADVHIRSDPGVEVSLLNWTSTQDIRWGRSALGQAIMVKTSGAVVVERNAYLSLGPSLLSSNESYGRLYGCGVTAASATQVVGSFFGSLVLTSTSVESLISPVGRERGYFEWLSAAALVSFVDSHVTLYSSSFRGAGRVAAGRWKGFEASKDASPATLVFSSYGIGTWHKGEKANSASARGVACAYDRGEIVFEAIASGWAPSAPESPYSLSRLTAGASIEAFGGGRIALAVDDVPYLGRGGGATDFEVDDLGAGGQVAQAFFAASGDRLEGTHSDMVVI